MSIASEVYLPPEAYAQRQVPLGAWTPGYVERSVYQPLLFVPPLLLAWVAWLGGGIQILTDWAFTVFTVTLAGCFIRELLIFPKRFGIGGLITFGGALLWWCYDYGKHWLGFDPNGFAEMGSNLPPVEPVVLAKAMFFHVLFTLCMTLGLQINKFMILSRLCFKSIEPVDGFVLFVIIVAIFLLSLTPYIFFSQQDLFTTIWLSITAGYSGQGATFTTGRTGNVNYSWGGYLTQIVELGYMGGTLAAFHAIMFTRSPAQRGICIAIFVLQCALAFGTGARGKFLFAALPVAMLLFLKYNYVASALAKKFSGKAYASVLAVLFALLVLVQWQGYSRTVGFTEESFERVDLADLKGNEMFTTTLAGMQLFPEQFGFMDVPFPGAGAIYAIPKTLYWFAIGPVPRALWTSKPIDPLWAKYNSIVTGRSEQDFEGTTISLGAVGYPYFRYGTLGLLEIAIVSGWILRNVEVGIRQVEGRPVAMLAFLGLSAWMFRNFRGMNFHNLYPVIYSIVLMSLACYIFNGGQRRAET